MASKLVFAASGEKWELTIPDDVMDDCVALCLSQKPAKVFDPAKQEMVDNDDSGLEAFAKRTRDTIYQLAMQQNNGLREKTKPDPVAVTP
jgi:hypothetical protein